MKIFVGTLLILAALVVPSLAQTTTGRLEGNVVDSQGAAVPGAGVKVVNKETNQNFETTTDEKGHWALPSMSTGTYTVNVSRSGFKTANITDVKIDAGVPATVNTTLEVGQLTETVEVQAGAEILQTATATVTNTLVGRQLHELPFTSRNLTELIVTQPGSATPGVPRSTSVYGLPQTALNVTLDGLNIQDNSNRSSDGFFNSIFPRADAIEEMTITSAAAGAESNAEGAVQMKLVTRSGTNDWHGGLFEQHRNEYFNANYYFNNQLGAPRDHIVFNQFGGTVGGPVRKNRIFVFFNPEIFQLPQSYPEPTGQVLTKSAREGNFTWLANGVPQSRNLYTLAAQLGFPSTPDPIIEKTLSQIASLTDGNSGLTSRVPGTGDYNRNNLNFSSKGGNYRRFYTGKLDFNLTEKHHLAYTYTYQTNVRRPDGVNVGTASPVYPGTQNVLNGTEAGNQGGIAFHTVANLRSTLTSRLTSEVIFGLTGGTVIFNNGINQSDFEQWRGFAPAFTFTTNPFRTTGQTRRNTPLKQGNVNMTYLKGTHLINFGGSFTQVNTWTTASNGTQFVPGITFNVVATDPIVGAMFVAGNFPGASATDYQTNAAQLYALLTGRVSAINRSVVLDEDTKTYGNNQPIVRNRQREIGIYGQDSWRVNSRLTFNYGLRVQRQNPPVNLNGVYTRPGYDGIFGVSGPGNMFSPGVLQGKAPQFTLVPAGTAGYDNRLQFSPSVGLAYTFPKTSFKPLEVLVGKQGASVIRMGYAISTLREDASTFAQWGGNQGRTFTLNIDPLNNLPQVFGAPGSVLFRGNLPVATAPTTPSFPLAVQSGINISDFAPNLKVGYVQSWNIGFQREVTRDTVLEVRYVGNHGTRLWRNVNMNEINIFNNGFLDEFKIAQANLALSRATTPLSNVYSGGPGHRPVPIIATGMNLSNDATTATRLSRGEAGALANTIATTAAAMNRLTAAGYPINMFQVNPTLLSGAANLLQNGGDTNYHGLQVEVRRRMSKGLLVQGSYTWAHSISNEFSNGIAGGYTTLRDVGIDKSPSPYDIRHALKVNWIYELPFGSKRHFLGHLNNLAANKLLEGWQLSSVGRISTGAPVRYTAGRSTYNAGDSGVTFNNITPKELQDLVKIRKTTQVGSDGKPLGVVYYLPQSLIDNTLAAFDAGGRNVGQLKPNEPYIGPANTPGALGQRLFIYGPRQQKWDIALSKKTYIGERVNVLFTMQALNVFNLTNFLLFAPGNNIPGNQAIAGFGQIPTNGAYRDTSNTNDPGGRILEFALRLNF